MKRVCIVKSIILTIAITFLTTTVSAVPITTPSGLNPGDQYRLAFVTSQITKAQSTSIAYYDTFVTSVANSVPELVALETTWRVIGSTPTVNAKDHIAITNGANIPIYLLNNTKLTETTDALWGTKDTPLLNQFNITEHGSYRNSRYVLTGSRYNGLNLGEKYSLGGTLIIELGDCYQTDSDWVMNYGAEPYLAYSLYAISDPITVVPEPATLLLLGIGAVMIRKKR